MALFIWTCPVFVQKVQELFREKPPALPHASGNPVESSSLDNPVESCSLDVLAVFEPKSIDWAFQFSTSTGAVVVDVCCSSLKWPKQLIWTWQGYTKRSTSNRGFSAIPATFKLKENKQGPNLHLTETSHPPLFRNLFMHSRPSNSWFDGTSSVQVY